MNEIKQRAEHAQKWRRFLNLRMGNSCMVNSNYLFRSEWCIILGLCETAGWIHISEHYFLKWTEPGHQD